MEEFKTNLESLAQYVLGLGVTPLVLTTLTRRNFNGSALIDDLSDVVPAAREAASSANVTLINLNAACRKCAQAINSTNADRYNLRTDDRTHLNSHGTVVSGRMVAYLVIKSNSHLGWWIHKNATLTRLIDSGMYA